MANIDGLIGKRIKRANHDRVKDRVEVETEDGLILTVSMGYGPASDGGSNELASEVSAVARPEFNESDRYTNGEKKNPNQNLHLFSSVIETLRKASEG